MRLESQVIHGDLTANVLFEAGLPPAVIDFSPYWRPAGFALAVIVADALVWGGADREVLALVADEPEFAQLLLRALMRRLLEVELHDRASGRRRPEDVEAYGPAIDLACRLAAQ